MFTLEEKDEITRTTLNNLTGYARRLYAYSMFSGWSTLSMLDRIAVYEDALNAAFAAFHACQDLDDTWVQLPDGIFTREYDSQVTARELFDSFDSMLGNHAVSVTRDAMTLDLSDVTEIDL